MEEQSLLEKLRERLSWQNIQNNAIVKKVGKFTITTALIFSLLFTTSCGNTNGTTPGGTTNDDTHISDTIETPSGDSIDISEYSEILKTILTSDYYNNLIKDGKIAQTTGNHSCRTSNKFQAIPYGFLEDEGYDIDAIKNDELKCETDIFVLDGELYIACRVENKANIDYYTHYVIKYSLTEKELSDLNLTHQQLSEGGNTTRTVSFQAPFFIQELSMQKNATILSKAHITKDSEKQMEINLQNKLNNNSRVDLSDFSNTISVTYLKDIPETVSSTFLFFNKSSQSSKAIQNKFIAIITVTANTHTLKDVNGVKVYNGDVPTYVLKTSAEEYANSKRTATFYNTDTSSFIDMLTPKYSSYYGLN